jgi:uncharacterized repeat protein (TIGR04052 family)
MNMCFTFYLFCSCLLFLSACSPVSDKKQPQTLKVSIWSQGQPLACKGFYDRQGHFWDIQQLALFVSNLSLKQGQQSYALSLLPSDWQSSDIALIRPYLPECDSIVPAHQGASEQYNSSLGFVSQISLADADSLSFELSVPFALNHQNPLTQPSPLNLSSMFWSWRSGHKFFRMDLQSTQGSWAFHLGSVGCEAASSVRGPSTPCKQPNRLVFDLPLTFDLQKDKSDKNEQKPQGRELVLHLDLLLEDIEIESTSSCLFHGSAADSCAKLLSNMQSNQIFEWY